MTTQAITNRTLNTIERWLAERHLGSMVDSREWMAKGADLYFRPPASMTVTTLKRVGDVLTEDLYGVAHFCGHMSQEPWELWESYSEERDLGSKSERAQRKALRTFAETMNRFHASLVSYYRISNGGHAPWGPDLSRPTGSY